MCIFKIALSYLINGEEEGYFGSRGRERKAEHGRTAELSVEKDFSIYQD